MGPSKTAAVEIGRQIGPVVGAATYRALEYSLAYEPSQTVAEVNAERAATGAWRQNGRRIFGMFGFVTLTFEGEPLAFAELDAYANDARWKERVIDLPTPVDKGALVLVVDDLADDRVSLSDEPSFEVDRARSMIRIVIEERTDSYFQIGTDLYAGISEGRLTSLILSRVHFA